MNKKAYYIALIKYFDDLLNDNATFKQNVEKIINTNNINKKCYLTELIKNPNIDYKTLTQICLNNESPRSTTYNSSKLTNEIYSIISKIAKNEENAEFITYILLNFWSPIKNKGLQITSNVNKGKLTESYIKQFINNVNNIKIKADKPLNKIRAYKISKKRLVKSESAVNREAVEEP